MPVLVSEQNQDMQMASQPIDHQQCSVSRLYIEKKMHTHTNMCTRTHTETSTRGQLHVPEHTGTYQPANHKVLVFCFVCFFVLLVLKNWIYTTSKERSDVRFLLKVLLVWRLALLQTGQLVEAVSIVGILEKEKLLWGNLSVGNSLCLRGALLISHSIMSLWSWERLSGKISFSKRHISAWLLKQISLSVTDPAFQNSTDF